MNIINRPRQSGKTLMLIHSAYTTGYPIIVTTQQRKDQIIKQAKDMSCGGICVYTVEEWNRGARCSRVFDKVFMDEAEDFLKKILCEYLRADVIAATLSLPMSDLGGEQLKEQEEIK